MLKAVANTNISSATEPVAEMAANLRRIYKVPVAQPCANGFVSLFLALQCAHIPRNSYVLVPTFTMVAVPNAVVLQGAIPVFVDNSEGGYNPGVAEFSRAAEKVGPKNVRAVIVCHTYSVPANIVQIANMCKLQNWILIEDISECIGVKFERRLLGTLR